MVFPSPSPPAGFLTGLPRVRDNRTFWTSHGPSLGLLSTGEPSLFPRLRLPRGVSEVMEEEEWYEAKEPEFKSSHLH